MSVKYKLTVNRSQSVFQTHENRKCIVIDASNLVVGRLATFLVHRLKGKHQTCYTPNSDNGDKIIVINCQNIAFTGRKLKDKKYYFHTGFPGGLREKTAQEIKLSKNPCDILLIAVKKMLGKGPMANKRLSNMYLFWDNDYSKFNSLRPEVVDFGSLNSKNVVRNV